MPRHGLLWGRGALRQQDVAALIPGQTSREDVLLRLGPPFIALEEGRILVYDWGVSAGKVATIFSTMEDIPAASSVVLEFDDDGRLLRLESSRGSFLTDQLEHSVAILRKWYPGDEVWPHRWILETDPLPELWTPLGIRRMAGHGVRVKVGKFRDVRQAGENGTSMSGPLEIFPHLGPVEMRASRPVGDIIRAAVTRQLARDGFLIVENNPDAEVSGFIESFAVGIFRVGFAVRLDAVTLRPSRAIQRRYSHTWMKNQPGDFRVGPLEAIRDLQRQLGTDRELSEFLGVEARH